MKNDSIATAVAYIHGRIEAEIEAFAKSIGIPSGQLAYRVASLLLTQEGGQSVGVEDRMPLVSRKTGPGRKAVAAVAMAKRPHGKPRVKKSRMSAAGRERLRKAIKKRWATVWAHKRHKAA